MIEVGLGNSLVPTNARKLAELAINNNWLTRCTYVKQDNGADSIAIRLFSFSNIVMYGIWLDGRFTGGACTKPLRPMNLTQLKEAIQRPEGTQS